MYDEPFKWVTPAVNNDIFFKKYLGVRKLSTFKKFFLYPAAISSQVIDQSKELVKKSKRGQALIGFLFSIDK